MGSLTKGRIIFVVVILAAAAGVGAFYKYYFEPKMNAYAADIKLKDAVEARLTDLETTFNGYTPSEAVTAWRAQIEPWNAALDSRTDYFAYADWSEHDEYPEDGPILRFWYDETVYNTTQEFYRGVQEKYPEFNLYQMPDLQSALQIPSSDMLGSAIDEDMVNEELARLSMGMSACELLMEAGAGAIRGISLWPETKVNNTTGLVKQTVGLAYTMPLDDFAAFMEQLRTADNYFNVDALKLSYPYIGFEPEPQLEIEMLLTQARYQGTGGGGVSTGALGGTGGPMGMPGMPGMGGMPGMPGMGGMSPFGGPNSMMNPFGGMMGGQMEPAPEPKFYTKAWKWFKRYILYSN